MTGVYLNVVIYHAVVSWKSNVAVVTIVGTGSQHDLAVDNTIMSDRYEV